MSMRDTWLVRAALSAIHTAAASNGGYHPDTDVESYEHPLDFFEMQFLYNLHMFLGMHGVNISTEIVESGAWIIIGEMQDAGESSPVTTVESGLIFDEDTARRVMLKLRREAMTITEIELNEGESTVLEGKDMMITATSPEGTSFTWKMLRMAEPFEQKPFEE